MTQLDDALLSQFMHRFYGYGNLSGTYWFIGMEEGGGGSIKEITRRLDAWQQRGMPEVDDVAEYHRAIGIHHHFDSTPRLQTTWGKLIRIYFGLRGEKMPDADAVRSFQAQAFARHGGDVCLLELLPLPSPSTAVWLYGQYSSLPELVSREHYREKLAPQRAVKLKELIMQHRPKIVVFYGKSYTIWWEQIAGVGFQTITMERSTALLAQHEGTLFAVSDHPAATGITNAYFHALGQKLGEAAQS